VLLDVPVLKVEEINLELEDLRAHVSLRAELSDLVKINVGVDAYLDKVKLEIKGVEAQALLKVRLDRILDTFDRALEVIDNNPEILNSALQGAEEALEGARETGEQLADGSENLAPGSRLLEESTDEAGRTVQRVADEAGNVIETTLDESGAVLDESVAGSVEDAPDEEASGEPEVDATESARKKAEELGVDLAQVEGTGAGGRVLVKDVEAASRAG
jgi:pyruvate/2-oxoglutarate dehydrogenase complex dihydrolipoamide acyltransferase (E2) component